MEYFIKEHVTGTETFLIFYFSDLKSDYHSIEDFIRIVIKKVRGYSEESLDWFDEITMSQSRLTKLDLSRESYNSLNANFDFVIEKKCGFPYFLNNFNDLKEIYQLSIGDLIHKCFLYSTQDFYFLIYWDTDA